jgi:hypothetical protein
MNLFLSRVSEEVRNKAHQFWAELGKPGHCLANDFSLKLLTTKY